MAKPTDILLQDALLGKYADRVYPLYTPEYESGKIPKIDTSNAIYHKSATERLQWPETMGKCGGDKRLFMELVKQNYTMRHIPTRNPGIWANYNGQAHQHLNNCSVDNLAPGEREFLRSPAYRGARIEPSPRLIERAQLHYDWINHEQKVWREQGVIT
mmetsp:Transcript_13081/g.42641  ORF Transcript_13081/g.42641 Transcript_13081/m.42641 type:complete len:158 (-) Transcript_13081:17-490(-)